LTEKKPASYAGVHPLDLPYALDREYDYGIPDAYADQIRPGSFVSVPFGQGDRQRLALVTRVSDSPAFAAGGGEGGGAGAEADKKPRTVKLISGVCPGNIALDPEMMRVADYLRTHTLCTCGEAVRAMIPSSALTRLSSVIEAVPGSAAPADAASSAIYALAVARGGASEELLKRKFGRDGEKALKKMIASGILMRSLRFREARRRTCAVFSLALPPDRICGILGGEPVDCGGRKLKVTSPGQRAALSALLGAGRPMLEDELRSIPGVTPLNLDSLGHRGLVSRRTEEVDRDLLLLESRSYASSEYSGDIALSEEQSEAFGILRELAFSGSPKAALMEGVTGSGKTCVMLRLIDEVLASGRGVIVLLPEISLTPQSLSIFCSRYGERVAVMHSGLSAGERSDAWFRVKNGGADLVVGTRSAVFAPLAKPGLIVIDEEQEHTYKSDSDPRYHARDVARVRCAESGALMLLASATPSLESRKNAEDGRYTLVRLTHRYGRSVLPKVTVADMRLEPATGNVTPIGSVLAARLKETFARGEQSVLFLNRRGYNNYFSCASCGEALRCPNCSVSLTFHTEKGSYTRGYLACHWCGLRMKVPEKCPSCGSQSLLRMGYGTQRVEEELGRLLPGARILRMDTDSTSGKDAYDSMLGAFRRHEADVLLGTQMVTKGHDFPDVTLVGVLLADASLYYDDYRASERTFALLTQVIGRAGRRDRPGEAVIQTNNPSHEIIALAGAQDYEGMYSREIRLRKALVFPPFCDIALLTVVSRDERQALTAASELHARIRELKDTPDYRELPMVMYGPFEAPVYRVDGKYRMRIIIKCRLSRALRRMFAGLLAEFAHTDEKSPSLSVDFNPTSL
jgi:primosomal protein N' (replication factor Y)